MGLGAYGRLFGIPEFSVKVAGNKVMGIDVIRGAPCGATWEVARKMAGLSPEEAVNKIGLEVQYFCTADPAGWDPIYQKSPVHIAGDNHFAAFKKALKKNRGY